MPPNIPTWSTLKFIKYIHFMYHAAKYPTEIVTGQEISLYD